MSSLRNSACRAVLSELISLLQHEKRNLPSDACTEFLDGYSRVCNALWQIRTTEMIGSNPPIAKELARRLVTKRVRQFVKHDIGTLAKFPLLSHEYKDGMAVAVGCIERWLNSEKFAQK